MVLPPPTSWSVQSALSQKNSNGCVFCAHERAFCPLFFLFFYVWRRLAAIRMLVLLAAQLTALCRFFVAYGAFVAATLGRTLRLPKRGVGGSSFCVTRATKNSPPAFGGGIFLRMHGARRGISCFGARPCADFCICVAQRGNCFAPSCGGLPACAPFAAIFAFVGVRVKSCVGDKQRILACPLRISCAATKGTNLPSPVRRTTCIEGRRIPFAIFIHVRGEPFQLALSRFG